METEGREIQVKGFFEKHNIWSKLLSVVIAIAMWGFVVNEEESLERTVKYTVPITLTGETQLLEEQGLAVIAGQDAKVTLTVTGTNPNIIKLTDKDFAVTVDVSQLTEAKTYQNLPYNITQPSTSPSLKIKNTRPNTVALTLDTMTEAEIPVHAVCEEEAPDGYLYTTPVTSRDTITVKGPATMLAQIEEAYIAVPTDKRTDMIRESCSFVLRDADGNAVDTTYLSWDVDSVTVTVNTYVRKTVPLKITLLPSAEITSDMANVTIDPENVEIYGTENALKSVYSLSLGTLDLHHTQTGSRIKRKINLPAGVRLVSGQSTDAEITLQIDGVATQTLEISKITLVDLNSNEEKPSVTLETDTVQVTVRGKSSRLNALSVGDVQVSAQFDSHALGNGVHTVPVAVSVKTSEITIVEYTQNVTILVSDGTEITPPDDNTTTTVTPEPETPEEPETPDTEPTEPEPENPTTEGTEEGEQT